MARPAIEALALMKIAFHNEYMNFMDFLEDNTRSGRLAGLVLTCFDTCFVA